MPSSKKQALKSAPQHTSVPHPTNERITLPGETKPRIVHVGPKGGKYVKKKNGFMPIHRTMTGGGLDRDRQYFPDRHLLYKDANLRTLTFGPCIYNPKRAGDLFQPLYFNYVYVTIDNVTGQISEVDTYPMTDGSIKPKFLPIDTQLGKDLLDKIVKNRNDPKLFAYINSIFDFEHKFLFDNEGKSIISEPVRKNLKPSETDTEPKTVQLLTKLI